MQAACHVNIKKRLWHWYFPVNFMKISLQNTSGRLLLIHVNKQESFLTYLCERSKNETIEVMGPALLWKKVGHVILIQSVTSLQVLTFRFLLTCEMRDGDHSFLKYTYWGETVIQTSCKVFNWVLGEKWFTILIFFLKTFPRCSKIRGIQIGKVTLFISDNFFRIEYSRNMFQIYCWAVTCTVTTYFVIFFFKMFDTYIWQGSGLPIFSVNESSPV